MAEIGVNKLEELVKCAICLTIYQQPKALQCNHTFCLDCIKKACLDEKKEIICPICSKSTVIPDGGVDALPADFRMNEMIEVYRSMALQQGSKCMEHNRKLEIYCEDCNNVYCVQCAYRDHRSHNSDFINEIFGKHKNEIEKLYELLKQSIDKVFDALEILSLQENEIVQQGSTLKDEVEAFVQQAIEAVKKSGKELKEQINGFVQQKLEAIAEKKRGGENVLATVTTSMEHVTKLLESGSKEAILKEKQQMMKKMTDANASLASVDPAPIEKADIVFQQNHNVVKKCSCIGKVGTGDELSQGTSPSQATRPSFTHYWSQFKYVKSESVLTLTGKSAKIEIEFDDCPVTCQLVNAKDASVIIPCTTQRRLTVCYTPTVSGIYHFKMQRGDTNLIPNNSLHKITVLAAAQAKPRLGRFLYHDPDPKDPQKAYLPQSMMRCVKVQAVPTCIAIKSTCRPVVACEDGSLSVIYPMYTRAGNISAKTLTSALKCTLQDIKGLATIDDEILAVTGDTYIYSSRNDMLFTHRATTSHSLPYFGIAINKKEQKIYVLGVTKAVAVQILQFDMSFMAEFTAFDQISESALNISISIDSGGNVYVYNTQTSSIKKFTNDGALISELIVHTSTISPGKMTIDAKDTIYVTAGPYITLYNTNGDYIKGIDMSNWEHFATATTEQVTPLNDIVVVNDTIYVCHPTENAICFVNKPTW